MRSKNLPKALVIDGNKKLKIQGEELDLELPDFIASADEIEEALLEHQRERIRILNKTSVNYLNSGQIAKKARAQKRKLQ